MAKFTLTDAYISVNGVVLSDHGNQVTVEDSRDDVDLTGFGANNKVHGKGLGDAKINVEFFQDFAGGSVDATLRPLINSDTPVSVEVRPTSAAVSATNPSATMQGLLMNYNFLDGSIGEASKISAEFLNGADAGIVYATA